MVGPGSLTLDNWDRFLLALMGAVMGASAIVLFEQWATGVGIYSFLPWLWPHLFGLAGLTCFYFAANPHCRIAYAMSGSLTAGALFSRAVQMSYMLFDGPEELHSWQHVTMDVGAYLGSVLLVILCWRSLLRRKPDDLASGPDPSQPEREPLV